MDGIYKRFTQGEEKRELYNTIKQGMLEHELTKGPEIITVMPLTENDRFLEFIKRYGPRMDMDIAEMCSAFKPVAYNPYGGNLYLVCAEHEGIFDHEKFNKPIEIELLAMNNMVSLFDLGGGFYLVAPLEYEPIFEPAPERPDIRMLSLKGLKNRDAYISKINP